MKCEKTKKPYGQELILDLHECDPSTFTRKSIRKYFKELCEKIDMNREKLVWWDDLHTPDADKSVLPHLVGTSAIQFITTSNITIHTLDIMERVYLNIFSCKSFDKEKAKTFSVDWFKGKVMNNHFVDRV